MLCRAPSLAFCGLMATALGAGLAEVVVATSLAVASGAAAFAWLASRREARTASTTRASHVIRGDAVRA